MLTVYLEGVWKEIITQKGLDLFLDKGVRLVSNRFKENARQLDELTSIDLIVATNPDLKLLEIAKSRNIRSIFYALFPDQILGWDHKKNTYRNSISDNFKGGIHSADLILANSNFTKELIEKAMRHPPSINVCYLGVDSKTIAKIKTPHISTNNSRVLWNHMWRLDKGFEDALGIISELAPKMLSIDFIMGRRENFAGKKIKKAKDLYNKFLAQVKEKEIGNVYVLDYFKRQQDYWAFLKTIDVSFSCSYHESFGISMLEQQAAGIACIAPRAEVYTEIHNGSYLLPPNEIKQGVKKLINDTAIRDEISRRCVKNASKFSTESFVDRFYSFIVKVLD